MKFQNFIFCQLLCVLLFMGGCSREGDIDEPSEFIVNSKALVRCPTYPNIADQIPVPPTTGIITVQSTDLDSVISAINSLNTTHRALFFPQGIYNIPILENNGGPSGKTILNFTNIDDLEIYGESGTVVNLTFDGFNTQDVDSINISLFTIRAASDIYIHDLKITSDYTFDPNEVSDTTFKKHKGIFIRNSENVFLYNLDFENIGGDGVNIGANPYGETKSIFLNNLDLNKTNRNGLTIGGSGKTSAVYVVDSEFGEFVGNQQLDFEPLGAGDIFNIFIRRNTFRKITLVNNQSVQGAIALFNSESANFGCVTIDDNSIYNEIFLTKNINLINIERNRGISALFIRNNAKNISINNNSFSFNKRNVALGDAGILIAYGNIDSLTLIRPEPKSIFILNNTINIDPSIPNNFSEGIRISNADPVTVRDNTISFKDSLTSNIGIFLEFNDQNLPNTLDDMTLIECNNTFKKIETSNEIVVDPNSDINDITISSCN